MYKRVLQKMSGSTLSLKTVCVSLLLVLCVVIMGCTMTPGGSEGTIPVTSVPSTTASPVPALQSDQSARTIQLAGNVYGLSSDPSRGIDTITFSIGLPANAPALDLTGHGNCLLYRGKCPGNPHAGHKRVNQHFHHYHQVAIRSMKYMPMTKSISLFG